MTFDENNPQSPVDTDETTTEAVDQSKNDPVDGAESVTPPAENNGSEQSPAAPEEDPEVNRMNQRLERLGGEPAPVITPEEFARLQKAGQVHIDARGRVRTERPRGADPGVSLRKRRAWY